MTTLTDKQERFVQEYLIDLNATQAAIRAGYAAGSADVEGCRLLGNAKIAVAVAEAQAERSERTKVTQDRVLLELARIGFSDLRNVLTPGGYLSMPSDWDENTAAAISSIEVVTRPAGGVDEDGRKEIEHVHKLKVWDKNSALEKIGKHLGMFVERSEHTHHNYVISDNSMSDDEWENSYATEH